MYTMLCKYGERALDCLGRFHFHVTFGLLLWQPFNKTIIPLAAVEYEIMIITNLAQRASLPVYHLIFTVRSWNNDIWVAEHSFRLLCFILLFLQNP